MKAPESEKWQFWAPRRIVAERLEARSFCIRVWAAGRAGKEGMMNRAVVGDGEGREEMYCSVVCRSKCIFVEMPTRVLGSGGGGADILSRFRAIFGIVVMFNKDEEQERKLP